MVSKPSEELLLVAQEISFAKALAGNDKNLRMRALKRLRKWLINKSKEGEQCFTPDTFSRLWKGLYYCVWMSDKPLIQEETVEKITQLIHCFKNFEDVREFVRCFFQCMTLAWPVLDHHRMDKYFMLVRRFIRQIFAVLRGLEWESDAVESMVEDLTPLFVSAPSGMIIHIIEVYWEELAKIGEGKLRPETVHELIKPFGEVARNTNDHRILTHLECHVFHHLLRQSDVGIKHQLKYEAWKQRGFPGGKIDTIQEISMGSDESEMEEEDDDEGDDNEEETPLDPRAGFVNVELPQIAFEASSIIDYLSSLRNLKDSTPGGRKCLLRVIKRYEKYHQGKFPLGLNKVPVIERENRKAVIKEATERLLELDDELRGPKKLTKKERKERRREKKSGWVTSPIKKPVSASSSVPNTSAWEVSSVEDSVTRETKSRVPPGFTVEESQETSMTQSRPKKSKKNTQEKTVSNEVNDTPNQRKKLSIIAKMETSTQNATPQTVSKKRKISNSTPTTQTVESPKVEPKKRKKSGKTSISDWGNVSWDSFNDSNYTDAKVTPANVSNGPKLTPGSSKKVEFRLNRNTSQEEREYKMSLKKRPSIPFDAERKPIHGVLKTTPFSSPINPFYKSLSMTS